MEHDAQLKVQAWLDGELSEAQARKVAKWLEQDRDAAALAGELRNTRQALTGFEAEVRLPESREFYWSKIQREIRRLDTPATAGREGSFWARFRRLLAPASAVAVIVLAGVVLLRPAALPSFATSAAFETASADSGTFTYHDYTVGTTLVWLSYPADNEIADENEMGIVE
jgi:hypothetical protein